MIRNVRLRARVLHDGEIQASLTLELESAREFWFRQLCRGILALASRPWDRRRTKGTKAL